MKGFPRLLRQAQAVHRLLDSLRGQPCYRTVEEAQVASFLAALDGVELSPTEVATLTVELLRTGFPEDDAQRLASAVSALQTASSGGPRPRFQDFQNIIHFMKHDHWATFADRRLVASSKLDVMLLHALNLGLRNPTEATQQTLVTLWLVSVYGADQVLCMPWCSKLQHLHMVKKVWKRVVSRETPPRYCGGASVLAEGVQNRVSVTMADRIPPGGASRVPSLRGRVPGLAGRHPDAHHEQTFGNPTGYPEHLPICYVPPGFRADRPNAGIKRHN